jgi:hypothetical protein
MLYLIFIFLITIYFVFFLNFYLFYSQYLNVNLGCFQILIDDVCFVITDVA